MLKKHNTVETIIRALLKVSPQECHDSAGSSNPTNLGMCEFRVSEKSAWSFFIKA